MLICLNDNSLRTSVESIIHIIKKEVNVKEIKFIEKDSDLLVKKLTPIFSKLGPKYKQYMGQISKILSGFDHKKIQEIEDKESFSIMVNNQKITINLDEVTISTEDIKGWAVSKDNQATIALDTNIDYSLKSEGITRDIINRIQKHRKKLGLDVVDNIKITIFANDYILKSLKDNQEFLAEETLANQLIYNDTLANLNISNNLISFEIDDNKVAILISKNNRYGK